MALGNAASNAGLPHETIEILETLIKQRRTLLNAGMVTPMRRYDLACDLDELGLVLRDASPNRRTEALGLVRESLNVLEQLDRDDPQGCQGRRGAVEAIRGRLALEW